jgi:hypothetical protein
MATITTWQIFTVGFLGGLAAVFGGIAFVALSFAAYQASARLHHALEERRARREDLKTCRAIEALGTTTEPSQD